MRITFSYINVRVLDIYTLHTILNLLACLYWYVNGLVSQDRSLFTLIVRSFYCGGMSFQARILRPGGELIDVSDRL